jgi:hypothetical protein
MEEIKEQEVVSTENEVDSSDKLSNREALQKAITEVREIEPEPQKESPTPKETKQIVDADPEPPSEFTAEGKEAWKNKDIRGIQKEYQRINTSRLQELSRAQTAEKQAREEAKTWKQLGEMAKPYIEARGQEGVTPDKAIMEALALVNEFRKANPATVKQELKRLGIDLDKAPENQVAIPKEVEEKINHLQNVTDQLHKEREAQRLEAVAVNFDTAFKYMASQKDRTGQSIFPDTPDNSEKGIELASNIGSLIRDPKFQQGVSRRIPDADFNTLVVEAYKFLGGRVTGEAVKVSEKNNQQQVEKSRRAAASAPSKTVARNDEKNLVGKLDRRAAIARAINEYRDKY